MLHCDWISPVHALTSCRRGTEMHVGFYFESSDVSVVMIFFLMNQFYLSCLSELLLLISDMDW